MSNRHYRDDLADIEEETFAMLGSRFSKVATPMNHRAGGRRRHPGNEAEHRESLRKWTRPRERADI